MFTGIIEAIGEIKKLSRQAENLHIEVESNLASELKIDQSVSHNGVCLTVVQTHASSYEVTAIKETLKKSNIGLFELGEAVNLERAMKLGDRLDGHLVQGHIDQIGTCTSIMAEEGSWRFTFKYDDTHGNITIEKGSITVNGVSLTVVDSKKNEFSVAIIPFTYQNTNFNAIKIGSKVNLEFDLIGKYLKKLRWEYS